jgi:hypothetical protein
MGVKEREKELIMNTAMLLIDIRSIYKNCNSTLAMNNLKNQKNNFFEIVSKPTNSWV